MEKSKVYKTTYDPETNRLIIKNLSGMFTKNSNRKLCGSVGLLQNNLSLDPNEHGLYLTTRTEFADGRIEVEFKPIYDEEGNQVFITGHQHVQETPFAFGDSTDAGYSYLVY